MFEIYSKFSRFILNFQKQNCLKSTKFICEYNLQASTLSLLSFHHNVIKLFENNFKKSLSIALSWIFFFCLYNNRIDFCRNGLKLEHFR